jgi:cephalosporin-C deacetylase
VPQVDLPLAELEIFVGRTPRPDDFEAYWAAALAELAAVDPRAELRPRLDVPSPHAECFDLWFDGVGGARIYAKYVRPRRPGPSPAVLQFHGYSDHSGDWFDKLAWVAGGFCHATMDCRGQGGRSEDNLVVRGTTLRGHIIRGLDDPDPHRLAFRQVFLDTVQLARVLMHLPEVDAARVGCCGRSQGGGLALACAALEPRIKRVAAVFPFLCDYQRVWEMDLGGAPYEELRYFFRNFDPQHRREAEIFRRLGYIDCQHLAPRIRAKTLMFTGLMDTICPPSTQFAAYNRITAPKEMRLYPDFAHETLPGYTDLLFQFMGEL